MKIESWARWCRGPCATPDPGFAQGQRLQIWARRRRIQCPNPKFYCQPAERVGVEGRAVLYGFWRRLGLRRRPGDQGVVATRTQAGLVPGLPMGS